MNIRFRRAALVMISALALTACTSQPVRNVEQSPIRANKSTLTSDDVSKAIIRAGAGLGWQMNADRPGHVLGTLALRTHLAVVDVIYDTNSYSIKYKDSKNLDYSSGSIHKNYNSWVQNLDRAIQVQISTL